MQEDPNEERVILVRSAEDSFACIEGGLGFFFGDGSDSIQCVAGGDE